MAKLPKLSHFRKPLLSFLAKSLDVVTASALLSSGSASVLAALSTQYDPSASELFTQHRATSHPVKVSTSERKTLQQFVLEQCPTKSGKKLPRLLGTHKQLYARYVADLPHLLLETLHDSISAEQSFHSFQRSHTASESALYFLDLSKHPKPESSKPLFANFICHSLFDFNIVWHILSFLEPVHLHARSRPFFDKITRGLGVVQVKTYRGEFDCRKCLVWRENQDQLAKLSERSQLGALTTADSVLFAKLQDEVEKGKQHQQAHIAQAQALKNAIALLSFGEVLIQMDFGSLNLQPNVAEKDKAPVQALILVIHSVDSVGNRDRQYIVALCEDKGTQKNDYFFVYRVLVFLFLHSRVFSAIKAIRFWSDTAAKHFRQRYMLRFEAELSAVLAVPVSHSFSAAYHGHSLADALIGVIMQAVRRALIVEQDKRVKQQSTTATPFRTASDLLPVFASIKKLTAIVFPRMPRDAGVKPRCLPLEGVMQMHDFDVSRLDIVQMRHLTAQGDVHEQKWRFSVEAAELHCLKDLVFGSAPESHVAANLTRLKSEFRVAPAEFEGDLPRAQGQLANLMPSVHAFTHVFQPAAELKSSTSVSASQSKKVKRKTMFGQSEPRLFAAKPKRQTKSKATRKSSSKIAKPLTRSRAKKQTKTDQCADKDESWDPDEQSKEAERVTIDDSLENFPADFIGDFGDDPRDWEF